jgi:hypothetical protein
MPDIPILGQTPARSNGDALHTDDLTDEQRAALAKMAEENPPSEDEIGTPVTTAFPDDIYGAVAVVQKDLTVMETAQRTQQQMMAVGQAMQRQAQEAQLRASLKL